MSTVYTKTDNYALSLYGDNDPADLRDGYNGSMRTIDATLETHLNRIEGVESRETHDEEVVKALLGDNTVDGATAAKTKWDGAVRKSDLLEPKVQTLDTKVQALEPKVQTLDTKVQALEPEVQTLKTQGQALERRRLKNVVFLGDSWTESQNYALYNRFKTVMPHAVWHNYGVSGALVQELPSQVNSAKADTSLDPNEVTDVIVVAGTNSVFWTNLHDQPDVTAETSRQAFAAVRDYFQKARIMFFPNNSKTLNDGRNHLYFDMLKGAQAAGVETHAESLTLLCGHTKWFYGDDQGGVQHLSASGYSDFADCIMNVLQGGAMYQEGMMESLSLTNTSPDSWAAVDDNTVQIYGVDSTGVHSIGYLQSPRVRINYFSDQHVDFSVSGRVRFNPDDSTQYGEVCVIGCPNWYKRIAQNTLPYVFVGSSFYKSISFVQGEGTSLGIDRVGINSSKTTEVCHTDFFLPIRDVRTFADKNIELSVQMAPTTVTGVVL